MQKTNYQFFLGIDVSKLTLDYTILQDKQIISQGEIPNTTKGLKHLKADLQQRNIDTSQVLFCCENTGLYSELLAQWSHAEQYNIWLANPVAIKRSVGLVRGKNDKIDAYRIALYASRYKEKARLWEPPRKVISCVKTLLSTRTNILKTKKRIEVTLNEAKAMHKVRTYQIMHRAYKKILAECRVALKKIEKEIDQTIKKDEKLKKTTQIVTSVEGVGMVTAVMLIIYSNEFKNITDSRKMACYSGVAPFRYSSGTSIRGRSRVSHLANKPLKTILHMAALAAAYGKGELGEYYKRKVAENKNKMLVLNAIRNKILHRIYACIRDERIYEKNYVQKLA